MQKPSNYQSQNDDVIGYWNPDRGPCHFIPRDSRVFDSNLDATKASILVVGTLVQDCPNLEKDDEAVLGKKGDVVGVWGKPGLSALLHLAGVPVWLEAAGEKNIGKASPMKVFVVDAPSKGTVLPCIRDTRVRSRSASVWAIPQAPAEGSGKVPF